MDGCPQGIPIPELFARYNAKKRGEDLGVDGAVWARAAECVKCGKCEQSCPQHLAIRDLLVQVAEG